MFQEEFWKNQKHLNDYTDKLLVDLDRTAEDVRLWLKSLLSESESSDRTGTIQFPKTPLATRRTRKKPKVETITEDDEVVQFEARDSSRSVEVSFLNISSVSTRSTRSSRTASKNANLKISAQCKQTLIQKLRRPTRSKPGVEFVMPPPPRARGRRAREVENLDETIQIIDSPPKQSPTMALVLVDCMKEVAKPSPPPTEKRSHVKETPSHTAVVDCVKEVAKPSPPPPDRRSHVEETRSHVAVDSASAQKAVDSVASPDMFGEEHKKQPPAKEPPAAVAVAQPPVAPTHSRSPQVFDPYKVESVKKRVKAYEMLGTLNEEMSPATAAAAENIPVRVTRTKTRALARETKDQTAVQKMEQSVLQKLARTSVKRAKRISLAKQQRMLGESQLNSAGKENSIVGCERKHNLPPPLHTSSGKLKETPLTNSKAVRLNVLTSANRIPVHNTSAKNLEKSGTNILTYDTFLIKPVKPAAEDLEEKKREERRKRQEKADEAQRKRKELLDLKREEQRKKREEKQIKALQVREAMEREKAEQKQRAEREKEEKARQAAEREERQREELAKRKQQAAQRAQEFEERRRQEEAARLARIREQEEEQRRAETQRKREEAEAERQYLKRLAQEKEAAAAAAAKQQVTTTAAKKKVVAEPSLNETFTLPVAPKVDRPPLKPESEYDYFLADLSEGNSDSEDERPTHKIPAWVNAALLKPQYKLQEQIPLPAWNAMFCSRAQTPDLAVIFNNKKLRGIQRTSSAVWRTPPRFSRMPKD